MAGVDAAGVVGGLNVGDKTTRAAIRDALQEFSGERGYEVSMKSFRDSALIIEASPAEKALLKYDLPLLKNKFHSRGVLHHVKNVQIHSTVRKPSEATPGCP